MTYKEVAITIADINHVKSQMRTIASMLKPLEGLVANASVVLEDCANKAQTWIDALVTLFPDGEVATKGEE